VKEKDINSLSEQKTGGRVKLNPQRRGKDSGGRKDDKKTKLNM